MQKLGPYPDLLSQKLHFNKTSRGFIFTLQSEMH